MRDLLGIILYGLALGIGAVLGLIAVAAFLITITAGPIVVIIWVVWKLFFNL